MLSDILQKLVDIEKTLQEYVRSPPAREVINAALSEGARALEQLQQEFNRLPPEFGIAARQHLDVHSKALERLSSELQHARVVQHAPPTQQLQKTTIREPSPSRIAKKVAGPVSSFTLNDALRDTLQAGDWRLFKLTSSCTAAETDVTNLIDRRAAVRKSYCDNITLQLESRNRRLDSQSESLKDELQLLMKRKAERNEHIAAQKKKNTLLQVQADVRSIVVPSSALSALAVLEYSSPDQPEGHSRKIAPETQASHLMQTQRFIEHRIAALEDLMKQARSALEAVNTEMERLIKEGPHRCDELARRIAHLRSALATLQSQKESLQSQLAMERRLAEEQWAKVKEATARLIEQRRSNDGVRTEIAALRKMIGDQESANTAIKEEGNSLMERFLLITRTRGFRLEECMMLVKAAVINLDSDVKMISHTRDKAGRFRDKEHVFKEAHNEVKVALIQLKGHRRAAPKEKWQISEEDVRDRLDEHRVRNVFRSLQEMVVCYDVMSEQTKTQLSTADEIIQNAEILYALARHTLRMENKRLEDARGRFKANDSRLTVKVSKKKDETTGERPVAKTHQGMLDVNSAIASTVARSPSPDANYHSSVQRTPNSVTTTFASINSTPQAVHGTRNHVSTSNSSVVNITKETLSQGRPSISSSPAPQLSPSEQLAKAAEELQLQIQQAEFNKYRHPTSEYGHRASPEIVKYEASSSRPAAPNAVSLGDALRDARDSLREFGPDFGSPHYSTPINRRSVSPKRSSPAPSSLYSAPSSKSPTLGSYAWVEREEPPSPTTSDKEISIVADVKVSTTTEPR